MTRLISMTACAAVLTAGLALAQDDATPAPVEAPAEAPDRTEELLSSLSGCDEGLLGTYRYGIYLQGSKNLGQATFVVERAPDGSGATYRVRTEMKMAMAGAFDNQATATVLLDEHLGIVSLKSEEVQRQSGMESRKQRTLSRSDGSWKTERTVDGETSKAEVPVDGTNHWDLACVLLLARKVDLTQPGRYALRGVKLSEAEEEAEGAAGAAHRAIEVTVDAAAAARDHRGAEVQAYQVTFVREDEDTTILHVDAEHQVLSFGPEGPPVAMVAGTAEEVTQDLVRAGDAEAAGPKAAVKVYFDVLAKAATVDALDGIMDWAAIHAEMAAESPEVQPLGAEGIAALLKSQFDGNPPAIDAETVDLLMPMLEVKIDGAQASVVLPGQEDPFRLQKGEDGSWRITHFPH